MFIIPIVDGDIEENNYKLSIYLAVVTDKRPNVFFNEDESAIYLSKEGILEKYDVN